jgi:hypothetical protein
MIAVSILAFAKVCQPVREISQQFDWVDLLTTWSVPWLKQKSMNPQNNHE